MNKGKETLYLTTTLPYVNSDPHIGFAMEIIHTDVIARYNRLAGVDVFFNTGTDEHGLKIYKKAQESGKETQEYVDEYAERFVKLKDSLGLSFDNFIRTTDERHIKSAQEFWKKCFDAGDIYKKNYKIKYCVGCEMEKTDSELDNGCCPLHPKDEIEVREEENYFFKFSKYQKALLDLYEKQKDFVVPDFRFNEIKRFAEDGLKDFSISRLKEKMPWGVPVPGDDEHVMYVWFDALVNYISAIGWPDDMDQFEKYWPVVQFAGKDNLRQQSAMWQAMLLSAGISPSEKIVIHGFITSGGHKMSKSVGNVVNPLDIVEEYSTDILRYYITRHVHPFEDSDFTDERFKEAYNANLANGLGNLVSRIMKMVSSYGVDISGIDLIDMDKLLSDKSFTEYAKAIDEYRLNSAMDFIWARIGEMDAYIQNTEPFKTIKTDEQKAKNDLLYLANRLWEVSILLSPFMPDTSEKIQNIIKGKEELAPLFERKE